MAAKIDTTHVPYKGVGPAVPELIKEDVGRLIKSETARFGKAVKASGAMGD